MTEKELYQQKQQARLDEWAARIAELKARAAGAGAAAQIELKRKIDALDVQLDRGRAQLAELAATGEDAWDSAKAHAEATWDALKNAIAEADVPSDS
ncbi:MAG: coiled coil domain-containing protein [Kiritimatiellae bacterium]|jgi:hypothetical protein|nr:coiled coil domain-containing protein [Kiritimatiellia bacterium]MDD4341087.1 coiled coil domain-containing protein [Kiritimatiellia bacterium]MDY0150367.1 coiled coil domain-containing protein [Kiritimatiellia bacterium]